MEGDETNHFNDSVSSVATYRALSNQDILTSTTPSHWGEVDSVDEFCSTVASDADAFAPNGQLNAMYSSNMFEPFFSNIFSETSACSPPITNSGEFLWEENPNTQAAPPEEAFPFATRSLETHSFPGGVEDEHLFDSLMNTSVFSAPSPSQRTPMTPSRQVPSTEGAKSYEPAAAELQHYRQSPSCCVFVHF